MFKDKTIKSALDTNQRIGSALRDERVARGLSCAQVAQECKLQEMFVRAIEEGHTDYLPTHIYFRMFARLYADTLNIDPELLLGKLYPELPQSEKPEFTPTTQSAQARVDVQSESVLSDTGIRAATLVEASTMTRGQSVFDLRSLTSHAADRSARRKRVVIRAGMVVAGVLALIFIAKNMVLNDGFAGEESDSNASTRQQTSSPTEPGESSFPAYQPREKLELTIKAKPSAKGAGVVVIADGDTLFDRRMRGGEVYTWNSNYRFKLDITDKNQVEIFIGGQRLQPPQGSTKRVSGLEITQLNYEEMLAAPVTPVVSVTTK